MSGFGKQRVQGKVESIFYDEDIIKVSLSIYDTDGMQGLYVPLSSFRETTKDVASSAMQGGSMLDNSTTSSSGIRSWANQAAQNATQKVMNAFGTAVKKNKVRLKYGTKVYLVDESQIDVKKGDIVNAGQQLGMSGNTGRSSGPHLHFETSVQNQNGEWEKFDPKNYLAEMEVRSGITTTLDRNGKDYLAEARNSMALNNQPSQQTNQLQDSNMALLASITNSNDPTEWLSYMMQQNGETPGSGQDIISSLISSLFSAALTLGLKMRSEEQAEAEELALSKAAKVEETEENNVVKMSRSDVQKIQANASMMFDAESPEQGQQQSQRLA